MNSTSSSCLRVTGDSFFEILFNPSHQPIAKPARYIRPYQRTASGPMPKNGPMENAIGSMFGWTSTLLPREAPRLGNELRGRAARRARAPGEPELERRMAVGEL